MTVSKCLFQLIEELFPFPYYVFRKNRKLRDVGRRDFSNCETTKGYMKLTEEQIMRRLEEERQRASAMDEKTFKMTLALSVGMTILGSTAAYLVNEISYLSVQWLLAIIISVALIYILSTGFIAIGALRTLPSYGYGTVPLLLGRGARKRELALALAKQETMNIVRHLRNEVSYQGLRNGLILLFSAFAIFSATLAIQNMGKSSEIHYSICFV